LSEIETTDVQLELNGELDPGLLRPLDEKQGVGNQYLGVIMPMRL
jgi:DNA polymerase III sliding clamp (beta) subunit (PCNA family)